MAEKEIKSVDAAPLELIEKASRDGARVVFRRPEAMKPCPIGAEGSSCSIYARDPAGSWRPGARRKPSRRGERVLFDMAMRRDLDAT